MADTDNTEVQKSATMQNIIDDHLKGVSGYAIAEKYDMDTEKVKNLIEEANQAGKFIPEGGAVDPIVRDSQQQATVSSAQPLVEGTNPETEVETTKKK